VIVAVVSSGCHFASKWQPLVAAATFCSKVASAAAGCHFDAKWQPALSASTFTADLSLCRQLEALERPQSTRRQPGVSTAYRAPGEGSERASCCARISTAAREAC